MWLAIFGDVGVSIVCILNAIRMLKYKSKTHTSQNQNNDDKNLKQPK